MDSNMLLDIFGTFKMLTNYGPLDPLSITTILYKIQNKTKRAQALAILCPEERWHGVETACIANDGQGMARFQGKCAVSLRMLTLAVSRMRFPLA